MKAYVTSTGETYYIWYGIFKTPVKSIKSVARFLRFRRLSPEDVIFDLPEAVYNNNSIETERYRELKETEQRSVLENLLKKG